MNRAFIDAFKDAHKDVTLVMASKYLKSDEFYPFYEAGIKDFGENRVEALLKNKEALRDLDIRWHYIGTLQTKKVKKVINAIDVLHTLDRLKLAEEIEKRRDNVLECFVQVNISSESQKHGLSLDEVDDFLNDLKAFKKIKVIGFMGMAMDTDDETVLTKQFKKLVALKEHYHVYPYLSMGMSQDYRVALKLGSTHVRLGRILLSEDSV